MAVLEQSSISIACALAVAQQKYGRTLTLTGPDDFQRRAVAAAVEHNMSVKFANPQLEAMRVNMLEARRLSERDAHKKAQERVKAAEQAPQAEQSAPMPAVELTADTSPGVIARHPSEAKKLLPIEHLPQPVNPAPEAQEQAQRADADASELPTPVMPMPLLSCVNWIENQSTRRQREPTMNKATELFVVNQAADGVVLSYGREVAIHPLPPGVALRVGQQVSIDKNGVIVANEIEVGRGGVSR